MRSRIVREATNVQARPQVRGGQSCQPYRHPGSERLLRALCIGSSPSFAINEGLSAPPESDSAVVTGRWCSGGRITDDALAGSVDSPPLCSACLASSSSRSRFCSNKAPPSVAHLRIVCIKWFCCRGFDRYSSIWASIHFSRSPIIA